MPSLLKHHQGLLIATVIEYFSFGVLIRTLFAPWKRDELVANQPSLGERFQLLALNLMGRLIGAVVRSCAIVGGLVVLLGVLTLCLFLWIGWLLAPFLGLGLIGLGVGTLLGGGQ